MDKKDVSIHFRCTKKEEEDIEQQAKMENKARSAYLRDAALCRNVPKLDPETKALLKQFQENELRIGVNINQAVRLCNSKKNVSREDYERLTNMLLRILKYRQMLNDLLIEKAVGEE